MVCQRSSMGQRCPFDVSSCGTARVLLAPCPSVTLQDSVEGYDLAPWQRCRYRTCCMQLVSEKFSSHDNMHAEVVRICSHLCYAPCIMRGCWAAQALAVALPGSD